MVPLGRVEEKKASRIYTVPYNLGCVARILGKGVLSQIKEGTKYLFFKRYIAAKILDRNPRLLFVTS